MEKIWFGQNARAGATSNLEVAAAPTAGPRKSSVSLAFMAQLIAIPPGKGAGEGCNSPIRRPQPASGRDGPQAGLFLELYVDPAAHQFFTCPDLPNPACAHLSEAAVFACCSEANTVRTRVIAWRTL